MRLYRALLHAVSEVVSPRVRRRDDRDLSRSLARRRRPGPALALVRRDSRDRRQRRARALGAHASGSALRVPLAARVAGLHRHRARHRRARHRREHRRVFRRRFHAASPAAVSRSRPARERAGDDARIHRHGALARELPRLEAHEHGGERDGHVHDVLAQSVGPWRARARRGRTRVRGSLRRARRVAAHRPRFLTGERRARRAGHGALEPRLLADAIWRRHEHRRSGADAQRRAVHRPRRDAAGFPVSGQFHRRVGAAAVSRGRVPSIAPTTF